MKEDEPNLKKMVWADRQLIAGRIEGARHCILPRDVTNRCGRRDVRRA